MQLIRLYFAGFDHFNPANINLHFNFLMKQRIRVPNIGFYCGPSDAPKFNGKERNHGDDKKGTVWTPKLPLAKWSYILLQTEKSLPSVKAKAMWQVAHNSMDSIETTRILKFLSPFDLRGKKGRRKWDSGGVQRVALRLLCMPSKGNTLRFWMINSIALGLLSHMGFVIKWRFYPLLYLFYALSLDVYRWR